MIASPCIQWDPVPCFALCLQQERGQRSHWIVHQQLAELDAKAAIKDIRPPLRQNGWL